MSARAGTSVLIPCWNALELTQVCLGQLLLWTTSAYELILVDNGSRAPSAAWLREFAFGARRRSARGSLKRVRLLRNAENRGYAAAMNQALAEARGELVVLGNCDVAVTPLWLEGMRRALRGRPRAGGLSPCSNPVRESSAPRSWSSEPWYRGVEGLARFSEAARLGPAPDFAPAQGFIPGFWFMASRALLRRLGGLDERFSPGGYEDWDLQWRLRRAGWELGFANRVFVHHVWFGCGQANGLKRAELYGPERRRLFLEKHPDAAEARLGVRTFFDRLPRGAAAAGG